MHNRGMAIRIGIAGVTGWTGSALAQALQSGKEPDLKLVAGFARSAAGKALGDGVVISKDLDEALARTPFDVLIDYTKPDSVKARTLAALARGVRVVVGTSGLTAADYTEIEQEARERKLGVVAAGNFSVSAALAKHFALTAARYLPSWEIIDYASSSKVDAPSGTVRELAEALSTAVGKPEIEVPLERMHGPREARGTAIGGTQVHSVRLPGYVIAFETILGLPDERLAIRHDAGASAGPYVAGTLIAARKAMVITGLVRGMDRLLGLAGN